MATKMLKTAKRTVTLDARPDRPDLRDRVYQPPLVSLPHQYPPPEWIKTYLPRYSKAGLILDQVEVAVVPGEAFGTPGYLRLSYALGDDDLVEGVGRIQRLLAR